MLRISSCIKERPISCSLIRRWTQSKCILNFNLESKLVLKMTLHLLGSKKVMTSLRFLKFLETDFSLSFREIFSLQMEPSFWQSVARLSINYQGLSDMRETLSIWCHYRMVELLLHTKTKLCFGLWEKDLIADILLEVRPKLNNYLLTAILIPKQMWLKTSSTKTLITPFTF